MYFHHNQALTKQMHYISRIFVTFSINLVKHYYRFGCIFSLDCVGTLQISYFTCVQVLIIISIVFSEKKGPVNKKKGILPL